MKPHQREPINDIEIGVVACKRSGHHAVMTWLADQLPATPFYANNCRVGENPFTETRKSLERSGREREAETYRQEEDGHLTRKGLLIYNFEDCDLEQVFSPEEIRRRENALGPSRTRHNVLVLRDHYNLFASRVQRIRIGSDVPRENLKKALAARHLYEQHAREALGETRFLGKHGIVILYNRWFHDEAYRREISARLDGTYREKTLNEVATYGEGSSFDGVGYDRRAHEMPVLERWKSFGNNLFFHAIVGRRVLRRVTARLFPEIDFPSRSVFHHVASRIAFGAFCVLDRLVRVLRHRGIFP